MRSIVAGRAAATDIERDAAECPVVVARDRRVTDAARQVGIARIAGRGALAHRHVAAGAVIVELAERALRRLVRLVLLEQAKGRRAGAEIEDVAGDRIVAAAVDLERVAQ